MRRLIGTALRRDMVAKHADTSGKIVTTGGGDESVLRGRWTWQEVINKSPGRRAVHRNGCADSGAA